MKKLMLILGLGLMIGTVNINRMEAQIHVSINIDVQPAWGPSGYDYAEFYYIPELNIYYDVMDKLFYYYNRGRWISALYLPVMYSDYDFYSLYKVVLNNIHHPWKYNHRHRGLYARYHHNYVQVPIFYMNDQRYHHARNNYYGWVEPHHMPGNNGRPPSREFSKNTRNGRISHDSRPPANTVRSRSSAATHNDAGKSSPSVSSRPDNSRNSTPENRRTNSGRSGTSANENRSSAKDAAAGNRSGTASGRSSAATRNDAGKSPSTSSQPDSRSSTKDATVNNNSRSTAGSKSPASNTRPDARKDASSTSSSSKRSSSGPSVGSSTRRTEGKSSQTESTKGTSRSSNTEKSRSSGRK